MAEQELGEEFEEQVINDEYKTWKKNSPYLYDLLISRALQWPSLTVDWLPNKDYQGDYSVQKIALGTHTNRTEQNHIRICNVRLPIDDIKMLDKGTKDLLRNVEDKIEPQILINHEDEPNRIRVMP
jgi:histone-binding protein RBBP4